MKRFLVVVEETEDNYSAYTPDAPTCFATGTTKEEALRYMKEALTAHLSGLVEVGEPVPEVSASAEYIEVSSESQHSS
jgi:predicted RNase H-like HicB family nuclease